MSTIGQKRTSMSYYETISNGYRFGRVCDDKVDEYMPGDLRPLVDYLVREHGIALVGLYLENYKSPDFIVVMSGDLPMAALRQKFGDSRLRFGDKKVSSDQTFSSLEGN